MTPETLYSEITYYRFNYSKDSIRGIEVDKSPDFVNGGPKREGKDV